MSFLPKGAALSLRTQGRPKEPKGRSKLKKSEDSCIYVVEGLRGSEIARLEECYSEVLLPLIWRNLIRVTGQLTYSLAKVDYYTPVYLTLHLLLPAATFTQPVLDYECTLTEAKGLKDFGVVREELGWLLAWVDVQCLVPSLITLKQESVPRQNLASEGEGSANKVVPTKSKLNVFDPFAAKPRQSKLSLVPA